MLHHIIKNWGFCISEKQKKKLKDGIYEVFIDTKHFKRLSKLWGINYKRKIKKEVFLSTYICHPSLANNEISGPSVLTFLAKWINSIEKEDTLIE